MASFSYVIRRTDSKFWSGKRWVAEYPDALVSEGANGMAERAFNAMRKIVFANRDNPSFSGAEVWENYGMSNETVAFHLGLLDS